MARDKPNYEHTESCNNIGTKCSRSSDNDTVMFGTKSESAPNLRRSKIQICTICKEKIRSTQIRTRERSIY